ncbi:MAG: polysulfide reductase NrfD [Coriobacteriales bacterium]|jgi:formate-dependent nitrite reductase membrane component NrfD|nr:polysulfide reductase NrfD [Coriobacteriales bacterium]
MIFNALIIAYLFLGGVGAGLLVVLSLFELSCLRHQTVLQHLAAVKLSAATNQQPRASRPVTANQQARTTRPVTANQQARTTQPITTSKRAVQPITTSERARLIRPITRIWQKLSQNSSRSVTKTFLEIPDGFLLRCWLCCMAILGFAAICLLFDLGRTDRVLILFTSPSLSILSIGTYSLLIALCVSTSFVVLRLFKTSFTFKMIVLPQICLGIISGLTTAIYTGLLLQGFASILFYNNPMLPVLFALSALSTGSACVFLNIALTNSRRSLLWLAQQLARIDVLLYIIEILVLAIYLVLAYLDAKTTSTAMAFLTGDLSGIFWIGLVGCGMLIPLVLELCLSGNICLFSNKYLTQLLWIALFALIGGFILRYCIVSAASFDLTQMPFMVYHTMS